MSHVSRFFERDCIWAVLCDKSHMIRENAAKALRACFELLQTRRKEIYEKFYTEIYILVATTCAEKKHSQWNVFMVRYLHCVSY